MKEPQQVPTDILTARVRRRDSQANSDNQPLARQWRLLEQLSAHPQGMTVKELAQAAGVSVKTVGRDLALFKRLGFDVAETVEGYGRKLWRVCHSSEVTGDRRERYWLIRETVVGLRRQAESLGDALLAADFEALEWRLAKKCEEKKPKPR